MIKKIADTYFKTTNMSAAKRFRLILMFSVCSWFCIGVMYQIATHDFLEKDVKVESQLSFLTTNRTRKQKRAARKYIKPSVYQLYHNVCITQKELKMHARVPYLPYITTYDRSRNSSSNTYLINLFKDNNDSYWTVRNYNISVPRNWTIKNEIAFFPTYLRDTLNIFLLWHGSLPSAYAQLHFAQKYLSKHKYVGKSKTINNKNYLTKTLIATGLKNMSKSFQSTFISLGYDNLIEYESLLGGSPVCYKYGIFGHHEKMQNIKDAREVIKSDWMKNKTTCDQMQVVIIQRNRTRRILDIEFIKESLEKSGLENVRIMHFEGLTLAEQYDIIRCTALLIGKMQKTDFIYVTPFCCVV